MGLPVLLYFQIRKIVLLYLLIPCYYCILFFYFTFSHNRITTIVPKIPFSSSVSKTTYLIEPIYIIPYALNTETKKSATSRTFPLTTNLFSPIFKF